MSPFFETVLFNRGATVGVFTEEAAALASLRSGWECPREPQAIDTDTETQKGVDRIGKGERP